LYYRNFATDPFAFVEKRFEEFGDVYRAQNPDGSYLYVVRKAEHCREVLATKSASYRKQHSAFERLSAVLGEGLVTTDGDTWKRQRRLVQPAFHQNRLETYAGAIVEESRDAVSEWRDGDTRDVAQDMMHLTMKVVARTLFSHRIAADSERVGKAMMELLASFSSASQFLPAWVPAPARIRGERALGELNDVIYSIIGQRRREGDRDVPHTDLLQALLDAVDDEGDGKGLSEKELRDQLMTLFLAGHETTSNALTWTLYLLSQNPAAYQKLRDETDQVLQGRPVTSGDLDALPYGEQVISESMRIFPPVAAIARKAHEDTEIGPYSIPAGSEVVAWLYFTHRDPAVYPNPSKFMPERFSKEARAKLPKMAYLPFGGGPRLCVGHAFAMLEARLILATLVQTFDFSLVPGHKVTPKLQITVAPKYGMQMKLRAR
jgi:cytochrome P450